MSAAESPKETDALATLRIPRREESQRPSVLRRLLKWVVVLCILAAVAFGGFLFAQQNGWLRNFSEMVPDAIRSLPEVRVGKVLVEKGRAADALVVATGYVKSRRQAKIGARAAGRIESVNVEEGTRVVTGQVIAVLEHKDILAALAASRASLLQARAQLSEQDVEIKRTESDLDRAQKLRDRGSNTESELDNARFLHEAAVARRESLNAAVELALARVEEAEQFKANMIILAPFDGTVISKDAEVGESILPGGMGEASGRGSVVTIADLEHLEVDCDVKEDYINRVTQGAPADVAVDAVPERRYKGRVRKIIPMGNRARATIKVEVEILDADERLFPDMSSTVYFLPNETEQADSAEAKRVFCEKRAVQTEGETTFVFLLADDNRVQKTEVTTGAERNDRIEITSGLDGGERVILSPSKEIKDGIQVKIRE